MKAWCFERNSNAALHLNIKEMLPNGFAPRFLRQPAPEQLTTGGFKGIGLENDILAFWHVHTDPVSYPITAKAVALAACSIQPVKASFQMTKCLLPQTYQGRCNLQTLISARVAGCICIRRVLPGN